MCSVICRIPSAAALTAAESRSSELQQELAAEQQQTEQLKTQVMGAKAEAKELQLRLDAAQVGICVYNCVHPPQ